MEDVEDMGIEDTEDTLKHNILYGLQNPNLTKLAGKATPSPPLSHANGTDLTPPNGVRLNHVLQYIAICLALLLVPQSVHCAHTYNVPLVPSDMSSLASEPVPYASSAPKTTSPSLGLSPLPLRVCDASGLLPNRGRSYVQTQ